MLRINFVQEDIKKLHHQRDHHPHPLVQKKMEAIYLKSQGVKHKDIHKLCQISKTTLTKYIRQYQKGGVEELKKIEYKGQASELNQYSRQIEEYFKIHPASSVSAASDVIERITGIKRSPTQIREFMNRIGLRCLKVGYVPGKSLEPERIKEVEVYRKDKLEPLLTAAIKGEKAVYFVDAAESAVLGFPQVEHLYKTAHFVHRAYLGFLWCFALPIYLFTFGAKKIQCTGSNKCNDKRNNYRDKRNLY